MSKKVKSTQPPKTINIPDWHIDLVKKRIIDHKKKPEQLIDLDRALKEIEQEM